MHCSCLFLHTCCFSASAVSLACCCEMSFAPSLSICTEHRRQQQGQSVTIAGVCPKAVCGVTVD
jgi:hypothetical protein